ncbi:hypothetical protein BDV59DRAFT_167494 [Aspergillus ambiguus]|uniref:uncharacterized protein n=1 Tax=Aspergillus ambiguus TaxID=176160 RepID=UPI003CCDCB5A
MDLANLITPGPAPAASRPSRVSYSPPASTGSYKAPNESHSTGSYFPAMTTATPATSTSYSRSPQPPLSPPVEDQPKCSLPSISTLLVAADNAPMPPAKRQRLSPPARRESDTWLQTTSYETTGPQGGLPPTPPLRPGSGFHNAGHLSPSNKPTDSAPFPQQPPVTLPSPTERSSISSQGSTHHGAAAYASPAPSVASYSSPIDPSPASSAIYYQPAAPAAAPAPAPATAAHQPLISPVTPAWQHHHYFPPSSSTPYQQNHDRYICRTCHKAFSRPSSLRIHSHSHTGEKPFRCTHAGCGKAFSVRSNMKRHERGCHSGRPVATAMV